MGLNLVTPLPEPCLNRLGRTLSVLALMLALSGGCAGQQRHQFDRTSYGPDDADRSWPATSPVDRLPDAMQGPPRPAEELTKVGAQVADPPAGFRSMTRTIGPASPPGSAAARGMLDSNVKPVAAGDQSSVPARPVIPPPSSTYPIDLATALLLADRANPTIGAARARILEALALQLGARTLLVPSLNSGFNYHGHDGVLQRSSGKIISLSEQSLYVGAGARTLAAESISIPGVSIFAPLADAWFEPLAARQRLAGARFGAQETSNDVLLDVALLHLELLGNQSILEAQRLTETQVHEIVRLTRNYAATGEGRQADADRATAQWKLRRAEVFKAEEELAVAAARLANRLNLDPSIRLEPIGGPLVPLQLIDLDTPQPELINLALLGRPDLQARSAAIREAEARYQQELGRPLLPTLWLGFSAGAFGGGSNLNPPLLGNFAGRSDFDVRLYWTLLDLGAGNLALIKGRRAEIGQAVATLAMTLNRARGEVSSSLAAARAAQNEIVVARRELAAAELAFRQDLDRTMFRGAHRPRDVLPIEVLNSLNLLGGARVNLVRALVRFDMAQFRLWVALGAPPPLNVGPRAG
jgi:outer membrane protein TolC